MHCRLTRPNSTTTISTAFQRNRRETGLCRYLTSQSQINGFMTLPAAPFCSDKHGRRDVKALGKGANLSDVQLPLAVQDLGNNPL